MAPAVLALTLILGTPGGDMAGPGEPSGFPTIGFENGRAETPGAKVLLGPGAVLRTTTVNTREAFSGEWYLEIDGVNHSTQYGLRVADVAVSPSARYELSFQYRMSESYSPHGFIVMVFQFDAAKKRVAAKYYYPVTRKAPTTWTEYRTEIETDPNARSILIYFRQQHVLPGTKLWLDEIGLRRGRPALFVQWEIDPRQALLSGTAKPSSDIAGQVAACHVLILRNGVVVKSASLDHGQERFRFELGDLTDDIPYYLAAVAVTRDGSLVTQKLSDVRLGRRRLRVSITGGPESELEVTDRDNLFYTYVKSRPWEGNQIGVLGPKDLPPRPWPPLELDPESGTVRTWNNTFLPLPGLAGMRLRFARPACELAREPIGLWMDGRPIAEQFQLAAVTASYAGPNSVVLASGGRRGGVCLDTQATIEFDGFLRWRLAIRATGGHSFRLNELALRLDFPKDYVRFYHTDQGLAHDPSYEMRKFHPIFWWGNFESGLCWCAERLLPSVAIQERPWLSLSPTAEGSRLSIRLVNGPVEVGSEPLVVEFGLLPTPCRPADPRLRNTRFRSGPDETLDVTGTGPHPAIPYVAFPLVNSAEEFRKRCMYPNRPNCDMLYYFGVSYAQETVPQVTYFKKQWFNTPRHSYSVTEPPYDQCTADYTTLKWDPSWIDLCLTRFDQFLDQTGIHGPYWDTSYPHIVEENGQCYCPVFAGREFHKRICVLVQRKFGEHGRAIAHVGRDTGLPYVAFSDFVLNGEHLRGQLFEKAHYLEFATLEELRATLCGPWGPAHMFLPQYRQQEKAADRRLMSQVGALTMVHDALPFVAHQDVLEKMMRRKYDFGDLSRAEWCPYWQPSPHLAGDNRAVIFSFYHREGDLFVVPWNTSPRPQRVTLKLSESFLRRFPEPRRANVYDPVDDRDTLVEAQSGRIDLDLAPYGTKLVSVLKTKNASPGR